MNVQPLSVRERFGYGVGDFGVNLFFIPAMTYLLYFYTDVFGLGAQADSPRIRSSVVSRYRMTWKSVPDTITSAGRGRLL